MNVDERSRIIMYNRTLSCPFVGFTGWSLLHQLVARKSSVVCSDIVMQTKNLLTVGNMSDKTKTTTIICGL